MRVGHEYVRNGALALLAALDVRTGKVFASTPATTGINPFMGLMGQVMGQPEYKNAARVFVIVDNGSDHRGQAAIKRLREAWPLLVFTDRYNQTARPFNWKFTAADLAGLLDRISSHEQPAEPPKAA